MWKWGWGWGVRVRVYGHRFRKPSTLLATHALPQKSSFRSEKYFTSTIRFQNPTSLLYNPVFYSGSSSYFQWHWNLLSHTINLPPFPTVSAFPYLIQYLFMQQPLRKQADTFGDSMHTKLILSVSFLASLPWWPQSQPVIRDTPLLFIQVIGSRSDHTACSFSRKKNTE